MAFLDYKKLPMTFMYTLSMRLKLYKFDFLLSRCLSEPKRGAQVTKKDVIDNPNNIDYIVTFDDGSIGRTRESKVYLTAASYPTFRRFLINCKVGDVWEGESNEKHTGESSDNTSNNTDK